MNPANEQHKKGMPLLPMGVIYFILFFIVWGVDRRYKIIDYANYSENTALHIVSDILFSLSLASLFIVLTHLVGLISKKFKNLENLFQSILGQLSFQDIVFIAIFSSICEEYFFRGLIQHYLGLVPASLMFGLLHSGPSKDFLPWTIFATLMGFVLGILYISFSNIFIPIGVHFFINFINLCFIRKQMTVKNKSKGS